MSFALMFLAWHGCTTPQGSRIDPSAPSVDTSLVGPANTTHPPIVDTDGNNSGSGDCTEMPPSPKSFQTHDFRTEEDFDFDAEGYLIYVDLRDLVGTKQNGDFTVFAAGLDEAAGIRVLPGHEIVVTMPVTGSVLMISANGGLTNIASGLRSPRGLEVDSLGRVYVSEYVLDGRVQMVDPATGEATLIANVPYPNGMALTADEQTLFVLEWYKQNRILAFDREVDGSFGEPRVFAVLPESMAFTTLAADICGNLYIVDYSLGRVLRIWADGSRIDPIIFFKEGGEYTGMRFGNGVDGWHRDHVYVTNQGKLFVFDAGVDGRPPVH